MDIGVSKTREKEVDSLVKHILEVHDFLCDVMTYTESEIARIVGNDYEEVNTGIPSPTPTAIIPQINCMVDDIYKYGQRIKHQIERL